MSNVTRDLKWIIPPPSWKPFRQATAFPCNTASRESKTLPRQQLCSNKVWQGNITEVVRGEMRKIIENLSSRCPDHISLQKQCKLYFAWRNKNLFLGQFIFTYDILWHIILQSAHIVLRLWESNELHWEWEWQKTKTQLSGWILVLMTIWG